jgi:hypothetical protein
MLKRKKEKQKCSFTQKNKKKKIQCNIGAYINKEWFGLDSPPVFSEILVQEYSKYIPKKSTEQRWKEFCCNYDSVTRKKHKHFSFAHVFQTLKDQGLIVRANEIDNILDRSIETAAIRHEGLNVRRENLSEEDLIKIASPYAAHIFKLHEVQHIDTAWAFSEAFWKKRREARSRKAQKKTL